MNKASVNASNASSVKCNRPFIQHLTLSGDILTGHGINVQNSIYGIILSPAPGINFSESFFHP